MAITAVFACMFLFTLLQGSDLVVALSIVYCSSQNTGSSNSPNQSIYQSNGLCKNTCVNYAFAILQDQSCWCSNYIPAGTTDTSNCDSTCPGYPSDLCGNASKGLYGYIAAGTNSPSGTLTAILSTSSTTSSTTQERVTISTSVADIQTVTVTAPSPVPASESSSTAMGSAFTSTPSTTNAVTTATSPIISVQTVAGQPVTITVHNPGSGSTSTSAVATGHSGSSLSGGAIAGIVIGSFAGLAIIVLLGLWFCFYAHRRNSDMTEIPDSSYQSTLLDGTRPNQGPQMNAMRNVFEDPGPSQNGRPRTDRLTVPGFTDNRLKRDTVLYPNGSRHSTLSLRDDQDYTRPVLRLTNPD